MKSPLVSIVLPTFNGERYIEQTIRSCLAQTLTNWELIIIDDASTDSTASIIERFVRTDQRIRSIRHAENRKLPIALNTGFAHAKGQYLTWISDDNLFHRDTLSILVDYLENHGSTAVVYSDYVIIDENGKTLDVRPARGCEELLFKNVVGACFLYRKIVHQKLAGYREDLFLVEDYDFWLRASQEFRLDPLNKSLYFFRRHSESLTSTRKKEIFLKHEELFLENINKIKWSDNTDRFNACINMGVMAREYGFYRKMYFHFLCGFWQNPVKFLQRIAKKLCIYRSLSF